MNASIPIASAYAAFLGFFLLLLSMRIFALKGNPAFRFLNFGANDAKRLERAVRGHGNFIEYTPIFLILLLIAEINGANAAWLHLCAAPFCAGRLAHGILFSFLPKEIMPLRFFGMIGTLFGITGAALLALL